MNLDQSQQPAAIPDASGSAQAEPSGIGGWLILPILGLIATIGLTGYNLLQAVGDFGSFKLIFTSDVPTVVAARLPIVASMLGGLAIIGTALAGLYRIFTQSAKTVTTMTVHYVALVIASLVEVYSDAQLTQLFGDTMHDSSVLTDCLRSVVQAAIWITYFHRSRRVWNTFVL